jgi:hypothetical protein
MTRETMITRIYELNNLMGQPKMSAYIIENLSYTTLVQLSEDMLQLARNMGLFVIHTKIG